MTRNLLCAVVALLLFGLPTRASASSWSQDGTIMLGNQPVITLYGDAGGLTVRERARIVSQRMNAVLLEDQHPVFEVAFLNNSLTVTANNHLIVTVDEESAAVLGLSLSDTAGTWAYRLAEATGGMVGTVKEVYVTSVYTGIASWYGPGFYGRKTASGEVFDARLLTAAHRTLPFGTLALVTNLANGINVTVRINDRGPYIYGRTIDLSESVAHMLNIADEGLARVRIEVLGVH
ncbi:MAG: septal ring lytic transglycosylase RlpA family protein [Bacillota bacterium]